MERRSFLRICGGLATLGGLRARLAAAGRLTAHTHKAALLVDRQGSPIRSGELEVGVNYLFHYPFRGVPCFLLNLGEPTPQEVTLETEEGTTYAWSGGAGPRGQVVAFSAICSHQYSHPEPKASVINYHHKPAGKHSEQGQVITCCAHGSVYDPARGAVVLSGPSPNPLPAITLEHDPADDSLRATGTLGVERFDKFFDLFRAELREEHGPGRAEELVGDRTVVQPMADYTGFMVPC